MNLVFANSNKEEVIYPLAAKEIAQAQQDGHNLQALTNKDKYTIQQVENTKVLCTDNKLVVPATLHHRAVSWYYQYLQHPGSTCLEETLCIALYWRDMHQTIQSYVKKCKKCEVDKHHKHKYGELPT